MSKVKAEYIWIDGYEPTANLRSKTKIVDGPVEGLEQLPDWGFDGSSTLQADGGTLAVGIFSTDHSISIQLLGVLSYGVFCLASSMMIFYLIDKLLGLRVDEQEEIVGLDISEHEMEAYAGFQIFNVE